MRSGSATLSVCIVSYNTRSLLKKSLQKIYRFIPVNFEIIVVDNGSTDGSLEMIEREFPDLILIRNTINRYFSEAYNQALNLAKGRYVLVMNSDIFINKDTIAVLLSMFEKNPDVGIVSCRHDLLDGTVDPTGSEKPTPFIDFIESHRLGQLFPFRSFFLSFYRLTYWDRKTTLPISILPGSFLLFPRKILKPVGLFDEKMKLFFSDTDYCLRVSNQGYTLLQVGNVSVTHVRQATTVLLPKRTTHRLWRQDKFIFYKKYFGIFAALLSISPF